MIEMQMKSEQIVKYLPLVKRVAARLMHRLPAHVEFDDIVGYGVLGLTEALKAFDEKKQVKFSTYAFYRIRGAMLDGLRMADWLPRPLRHKIKQVDEACEALKASLGRMPCESELAGELGMTPEDVSSLLADAQQSRMIALEDTLHQRISDGCGNEEVEEDVTKCMSEAIAALEEKDRLVVSMYYFDELNLKEIGAVLGLSESRVSQLLTRALGILKGKLSGLRSELQN